MPYRIENIGREFTKSGQKALEARLDQAEAEGWKFVNTLPVTQRTCLIFRSSTHFVVLHKPDNAGS